MSVRHDDERVRTTERKIRTTILEVFRENSPEYRDHQNHSITNLEVVAFNLGDDPEFVKAKFQQGFVDGIPRKITMLKGLIETVDERTDTSRLALAKPTDEHVRVKSDKVFVVHGRKEGPREAVARFIGQLGYTPVILQEQASEGRTIIEKFERHSDDVAYAVVLLTADDRGGLIDADPSTYEARARQNVILELGYFIGTLTRRRVCVVHEHGVEVPSDFHDVVRVPLDSGGWKLHLAKEMKAAGLDIDMNHAL